MQISKRLQEVARLVTIGNRVADIGCDHAYTSIYMMEEGIASGVIAMDVNQGPIDRAKENILKHQYESKIQVRKSDGLERLKQNEVDTILIAGMGGPLMVQILLARPEILAEVEELVLQPQSEVYKVREMLVEQGFSIIKEHMMIEDGKFYVMMKARKTKLLENTNLYTLLDTAQTHYGRLLLEDQDPILFVYLCKEMRMYQNIYKELKDDITTEKKEQRVKELKEIMECIDHALIYFKEKED